MANQLSLPFPLDPAQLGAFLTQVCAIEDEHDRLREELRLLKDAYADLVPLRAVLTAVKVVRARRKLEAHAKEPLALAHQDTLQGLVEAHLVRLDAEKAMVPDMV